jgi:hypothetical protein
VPGYQKLLEMAVVRHSPARRMAATLTTPPPVTAKPLAADVQQLQELVDNLQAQNRELRAEVVKLKVRLSIAQDEVAFQRAEFKAMRCHTSAKD